ncbi:hypothetical protein LguiA_036396 [Lonicera macranthoides]
MLDVKNSETKVTGNALKPKVCFSCGVEGHFRKDCPNKWEKRHPSKKKHGTSSRDNDSIIKNRKGKKRERHYPSKKKHEASSRDRDSVIINRKGEASKLGCFFCGKLDHRKIDCPYREESQREETHCIPHKENLVQANIYVEEGGKTSSPIINCPDGGVSHIAETEKLGDLEFKWGKKRGIGGKKKEVQFYGSFSYDGVEYNLYDCVYMHKEGEPEPYVGKLIKIWENADKTKKVKVQWFFRPLEILHWLGNEKALENEVFLASGDGAGLANVNPLEAIAGKCNVICLSKDGRNPQPSGEEIKMADYVFYRTFDVEWCTVLDKMDDKVGGLEIKSIFNRKGSQSDWGIPKLGSVLEEDKKNAAVCYEALQISAQNPSDKSKNVKMDEKIDNLSAQVDTDVKDSSVKLNSVPGYLKDLLVNGSKVPIDQVEEGMKSGEDTQALDNRPSKKARADKSIKLVEEKNKNGVQEPALGNDEISLVTSASFEEKTLSGQIKDSLAIRKRVNSANSVGDFEDKLSKKARVESSCEQPEDIKRSVQNLNNGSNSKDFVASLNSSGERAKPRIVMDSIETNGKPDELIMKVSKGKLPNASALGSADEDIEVAGQVFDVTRRPDADKSKWFWELPWEERMQNAHDQGSLVLLQNLDPKYTSGEVEDIIWHAFKENCAAKMVQRTISSSPHFGQALVILKTREATRKVITKLDEGCLMLPNGRPLVGCVGPPPWLAKKQLTFVGHLVVDNVKLQMQRDMREAVSTSHCSQPNTIEYDMAMEWRLLQSRSDTWWKKLHKQQGEDLKKLKANLKSK